MSKGEFNPFETTSGLPLADADVTVVKLEFGYDAQYMDGEVALAMITFQPDDGDEATQLYSVGKKFEPADRGERLVHESGENKNLNKSTNYGRFIDAVVALGDEFMEAVRETGCDPVFDAHWLDGFRFRLGTIKLTTQDKKEKDLIVPVEFLGVAEGGKSKAKAGAKAGAKTGTKALAPKAGAKASAKAKDPEPEDDETFGIDDDDVREALIEAAKDASDFDEYSSAVLDIDEVASDRKLQRIALSSKDGSIWSTYGGE